LSENGKPRAGQGDKSPRNKKQGNGRRRGRGRNSRWSAEAYKQRIDEKLFGKKGDAARNRLEDRLRDAHGSANFLRTYKEYLRGYGMPEDLRLLLLLLDLSDEAEVLKVLDVLDNTVKSAPQDQRSLVRSRLRNLEISTSSDSLADAATDLLGRL
jgi:hypothetical protein